MHLILRGLKIKRFLWKGVFLVCFTAFWGCENALINAGGEKAFDGLAGQGSCLLTGCDDGYVMNNGKCLAQERTGTIYYVDTNGNDTTGNGSVQAPWKTLAHAADQVQANQDHTIFLKAGVHTEIGDIRLPTGIHLQGEGINVTQIRVPRLWLESPGGAQGNQVISDLAFSQLQDRGVVVTGRHNVVIHDVKFTGNSDTACLQITAIDNHGEENPSPPAFFLKGIKVYRSEFIDCARNNGSSSSGALEIGHTEGAEIRELSIEEDEGYGIKLKQGGWHKGICVHDNTISINETATGQWGAAIGIELWRLFDDSEVYNNTSNGWFSLVYGNKGNGERSVRAHHNQIIFTDPTNYKEAFEVAHTLSDVEIDHNYIENTAKGSNKAVAIWGHPGQNQSNISIHHNIFRGSNGDGVVINTAGNTFTDIHVFNNVFDDWATPFLFSGGNEDNRVGHLTNISVINNIIMHSNKLLSTYIYDGTMSEIVFKNNILYQTGSDLEVAVGPTPDILFSENIKSDPQLKAIGNKQTNYYQPASLNSPAVDAGIDLGFTYLGKGPDIGVFEYHE